MESTVNGSKSVAGRSGDRPRNFAGYCAISALALLSAAPGLAQPAQEYTAASATGVVVRVSELAASGGSPGDDHGDVPSTATLLAIGATLPGQIDDSADTDMFRLDLLGRAEIEVRSIGQTDTEGELLDSTGARVMADDDGGPGDNFGMTVELDPGVYYVEVRGDRGDYAVNARLGGARDHGDTIESSTLLKLHSVGELAAVQPQVLLATSGRIYPSTADVDVFRIDVPDPMQVTLRTSGSVDTYASLVDSSENEIAADDADGNFRIEESVDAGIYYVKVSGHGVGAYRILGSVAQPPTPPTDPPAGDSGDALSGHISKCEGRLVGNDVMATILGTVTANRSVTDLELTGFANDHLIGTEYIGSLAAGESKAFDIRGSYTYDGVTTLECDINATFKSAGGGGGASAPDLVVESAAVDDDTPDAGASFTLSATVRNRGDGNSGSTTLRYYRSSNATITIHDTEVGTDSVGDLAASARSPESIRVRAPSSSGTYYFGACVDSVAGESDTANNCSDGVKVDVGDDGGGGGGTDSYCRDGDAVQPADRCDIFSTSFYFQAETSGRGCVRGGGISNCNGNRLSMRNVTLNGVRITFVAARNNDDSWTIEDVEPEPSD